MRTALDIVRDLVREEHTLAQRLEAVRAQLGALRTLAGVQTSPPRSGPARAAASSSSSRPAGRKAARARRAPRRVSGRVFQRDPDKQPPKTLREIADSIHAYGKVLDTGCHPLELQDQRDIGADLKYLAGWLHGLAAKVGQ